MLRAVARTLFLSLLGVLVGCAAPPTGAFARIATPESVTRHDPGGDALNPHEAALERLGAERIGRKNDKFGTLLVALRDARNWSRVRFFGHPTRAAFRYGDDHHAVVVIDYRDAVDDDSVNACLEAFVDEAHEMSDDVGVEVGAIVRSERKHRQGVESLSKEVLAKRRRAGEARRKKRMEAKRRRARALRRKRRAKAKRDAAASSKARLAEGLRDFRPHPQPDKPAPSASPVARAKAATAANSPANSTPRHARATRVQADALHRQMRRRRLRAAIAKRRAARRARARAKSRRMHEMPVVEASGRVGALMGGDTYAVAVAAYRSWPGTCLVQAIAVRIEQDDAQAQAVVTRWLDDAAPLLQWRSNLLEPPKRENR